MYKDRNTTEIFHNIILHTHFLLHLYLIPFLLYYISLIITKSRFEKDRVRKIKKGDGRGEYNTLVDEEDIGYFKFTQKDRELFRRGSTVQSYNLVQGFS